MWNATLVRGDEAPLAPWEAQLLSLLSPRRLHALPAIWRYVLALFMVVAAVVLRKALVPTYPQLALFHLADYKVRILDSDNGTEATTRVLIDTQNGTRRWSTVGASANIIEASWQALVDSVEYGLLMAH